MENQHPATAASADPAAPPIARSQPVRHGTMVAISTRMASGVMRMPIPSAGVRIAAAV